MTCGICEKEIEKSADSILDMCETCYCKLHKVKREGGEQNVVLYLQSELQSV